MIHTCMPFGIRAFKTAFLAARHELHKNLIQSTKSMVIEPTASPAIVSDYYTPLPTISPVTLPRDFLLKIKYWDPVNYKAKIEPVYVTLKSDDCTIKSILDRHIPQGIKEIEGQCRGLLILPVMHV
eukprot:NODE_61_length_26588_cov_1.146778.p13 type:complete len:126 gc:universal NODE_61_length_26588_cov_1.146778:18148-17771(-)